MLHSELILDGELLSNKTSNAGDTLLTIENFISAWLWLIEVYKSYGIPLQHTINDGYLLLAVVLCIKVVTLIFWLNGELTRPPKQTFAFQLVIDKALTYFLDRQIG